MFPIGSDVRLHNLGTRPEYNGYSGVVETEPVIGDEIQYYGVRVTLPTGYRTLLGVRCENLELVPELQQQPERISEQGQEFQEAQASVSRRISCWRRCCRRRKAAVDNQQRVARVVPIIGRAALRACSKLDVAIFLNMPEEAWLNMLTYLSAQVIARLLRAAPHFKSRLAGEEVARWCAESRRVLLLQRAVRGDMPLGFNAARWTLERVHLCEHPPRFPNIFFGFCQDALDANAMRRLGRVAAFLTRHPKLRIRIEGFADPSAPDQVGRAISQARALTVRAQLLRMLKGSGCQEWDDEEVDETGEQYARARRGFRSRIAFHDFQEIDELRCFGSKIQAVGRWGTDVHRNENLSEIQQLDPGDSDEDNEDGLDDFHDFDVNRRVDFTVLELGDSAVC